jgi:hypothetical protein
MTQEAIARRTNVPENIIRLGLDELMKPDPKSRSKVAKGRRILLIDSHRDWGWRIVNYQHYRKLRDDESRRSYFRNYMRKYRNGKALPVNTVNEMLSHVTQGEVEEEGEVIRGVPARHIAGATNGEPPREKEKMEIKRPKSILDLKDQAKACEDVIARVKQLKEDGRAKDEDIAELKQARAKLKQVQNEIIQQ